jgi:hypothetical protein
VMTRSLAAQNINVEHDDVWCAQGDDFRTFLGELVSSLAYGELATGRVLQA